MMDVDRDVTDFFSFKSQVLRVRVSWTYLLPGYGLKTMTKNNNKNINYHRVQDFFALKSAHHDDG